MLMIKRNENETVIALDEKQNVLGFIKVAKLQPNKVRLGFEFANSITLLRGEIYERLLADGQRPNPRPNDQTSRTESIRLSCELLARKIIETPDPAVAQLTKTQLAHLITQTTAKLLHAAMTIDGRDVPKWANEIKQA